MDLIREYWWVIAIVAALVLALLLMRPKQRVTLTDSAPVRPHMQKQQREPAEGRGIAGEAAAAATDVAGDIINAPVHQALEGGAAADDLCRLKGVGPKFAQTLHAHGFFTFEQIAGLSANEIERLDGQLGAFRGRITRDRIVEQADYLARNDTDGFEQKFGKL
ncbi:MAG TPA: helix-hairpin-helix domain-containing protein [Sphingomicrobium sp.]|jgi:predicted flap endonuclease-1-like 5' DNA nuclease